MNHRDCQSGIGFNDNNDIVCFYAGWDLCFKTLSSGFAFMHIRINWITKKRFLMNLKLFLDELGFFILILYKVNIMVKPYFNTESCFMIYETDDLSFYMMVTCCYHIGVSNIKDNVCVIRPIHTKPEEDE